MATIFFPPVGFKKFLMTYHNFDYKILKLFLIHEPIDFLILTAYLDFGAVESGSQTIQALETTDQRLLRTWAGLRAMHIFNPGSTRAGIANLQVRGQGSCGRW